MTPLSLSVVGVAGFEPATSWSQTRRDDRATLHPEKKAERQGLEPWRRLPVDRLAICSVTTPAPLLCYKCSQLVEQSGGKCITSFYITQIFLWENLSKYFGNELN